MVIKRENEQIKDSEHKEIEKFFKQNGGKNLQLLEKGLKIFTLYKEPKADFNEEPSNFLYDYDRINKLISEDVIPIYKTEADITCFNKDDNALVIIEIKSKSEAANHKTFGQILYYITVEKNNLINAKNIKYETGEEVQSVRGIILANENSLRKSLEVLVEVYENDLPKISLKKYSWSDEGKLIIKDA